MTRFSRPAAFVFTVALSAQTATAEQVINDSVSIDGALCVGPSCEPGDSPAFGIRLKSYAPDIEFYDVDIPGKEWTMRGFTDRFEIEDRQGDIGLLIDPASSGPGISIAANGVGFGTAFPSSELHAVDGLTAALRLEQDTSGGFGHHVWDIGVSDAGLVISELGAFAATAPVIIENGARYAGLVMSASGHTGMGTDAPAAALHLVRDDATAQILVEEKNATANPRTLLNLTNNGRPEIVMANTATDGEWSFGAGTDFFLKTGTVGSTSGAKTKVFTVKNNGDAIVFGTLTTGGTTCGTGCDRVFDADYPLPSIAEHAAQMRILGHLPNVGPTPEGAPVNVSDKLGRMLNELEHAHLYIAELEAEVARLRDEVGRIAALEARMTAIEASRPRP